MSAPTISQLAATLRAFGITSVRQMEEITTELLCRMPTAGAINGELSGDGNPTGAYYPVFVGQLYHDTTADTYYRSTGLDVYDWTLISGGAGYSNVQGSGDPTAVAPSASGQIYKDTATGNLWRANSQTLGDWTLELQNSKIQWLPKSIEILHASGFITLWDNSVSIQGITNLTLLNSTFQEALYIDSAEELQTLSIPNLTACVDTAEFTVSNCDVLTSISAPNLLTVDGNGFSISGNQALTSVTLTSFIHGAVGKAVSIQQCPLLTSLSLPALVPVNGATHNFVGNGLDAASVNGLLARFVANAAYVSGTIGLNGGTNSAPTGQGIADVATLTGRGVLVNTN